MNALYFGIMQDNLKKKFFKKKFYVVCMERKRNKTKIRVRTFFCLEEQPWF